MRSACVAPAEDILHTRCYVQSSIFIAETQDGEGEGSLLFCFNLI